MLNFRTTLVKMAAAGVFATVLLGSGPLLGTNASADSGGMSEDFYIQPIQQAVGVDLNFLARPALEKPILSDFTPEAPAAGISGLRASASSTGHTAGVQASTSFKGGRGGCSIQCITGGTAYAHGVGAELRVQTDTFAYVSVWVWAEQAQGGASSSHSMVKHFGTVFDDLEPGTTYNVMVEAIDGKGYRSYAHGSFTTLVRKLTVKFDRAELLDLPYGNNKMSAALWIEGAWRNELYSGPYSPTAGTGEDDSQYLLFGAFSVSVMDVDRRLNIALELRQEKTLWYANKWNSCQARPGGKAPPSADTTIYSECGLVQTYAFATLVDGMNDLDAGLGVSSWTETRRTVQLEVPENGGPTPDYGTPLDFNVPNVELIVQYVAK